MTTPNKQTNSQPLANQFLLTLQADKSDLKTLRQSLVDEREALEQRQHEKLATYTQQKNQLTAQLDQRYSQRLQHLHTKNLPANAEGWKTLITILEQQSKLPLLSLWSDVEQQLKECHKLLLINEKIVANLQNNVGQLLNSLRGATSAGQTYSASGKAKIFSDNQNITSA